MKIYDTRLLLVADDGVILRDGAGNEVSFAHIAEFERCSPEVSLVGKTDLGYEPQLNHFEDREDDSFGPDDIPYAPYEDLIDRMPTLQIRKDDITYGRSEQEIIDLMRPQRHNESDGEFAKRRDNNRGGHSESKEFRKQERTQRRIARKEAKGNANANEVEWMDSYDAMLDEEDRLQDQNELLNEYIEDQARTSQELIDLDVTDDIHWT